MSMPKPSDTQRAILVEALELDETDWYFRDCVYRRNLNGLIRHGWVAEVDDKLVVTDGGRAAVDR